MKRNKIYSIQVAYLFYQWFHSRMVITIQAISCFKEYIGLDFSVKMILNPQKISLHRHIDAQKKLPFFCDKIDQNTNFAKCFFCKFYHSRMEVFQNCSAFYCVIFSGQRKSERIERIIFTRTIQPRCIIEMKILIFCSGDFPSLFESHYRIELLIRKYKLGKVDEMNHISI